MIQTLNAQQLMAVGGGLNPKQLFKSFATITNVAFCAVIGDLLCRELAERGLMHPNHIMLVSVMQFAILPLLDEYFAGRTTRLIEQAGQAIKAKTE